MRQVDLYVTRLREPVRILILELISCRMEIWIPRCELAILPPHTISLARRGPLVLYKYQTRIIFD